MEDRETIFGIVKPSDLKDESELTFECDVCKDKKFREFDDIKDFNKEHGALMEVLNHKMVDGKLVETVTYKQTCECVVKKRSKKQFEQRIEDSGLSLLLQKNTFKNYEVTDKWQKELKEKCIDFVHNPTGMLALLGQTGSGKTHLGTATAGNLAYKGYEVIYVEWKKEMSAAKNNYYKVDEVKMEKWRTVDVLYIDDLFKVQSNNAKDINKIEFETAWEILDSRMNRNKITMISSEFTLNELYAVDESFAGRLNEYVKGNMFNIPKDPKKNYRMKGLI